MRPYPQMYDYLAKARERLFEWVRTLSPAQYAREFPYGFKTIHATLVHTASAEWIYGRRLRGEPASVGESPYTAEKVKAFAELEAAWRGLTAQSHAALAAVTDWDAPVEYRMAPPNAPVVRIRTTRAGVASQMILHEVHHRSQVMSMLRQHGIAAQNLDFSALMFDRQQEAP
jgi:uncharacterized damage-inducible protein DinB